MTNGAEAGVGGDTTAAAGWFWVFVWNLLEMVPGNVKMRVLGWCCGETRRVFEACHGVDGLDEAREKKKKRATDQAS